MSLRSGKGYGQEKYGGREMNEAQQCRASDDPM